MKELEQPPLNITYRNVEPSERIVKTIRRKAKKLRALCPRISSIDVAIELPHRHRQNGQHYHVRMLLHVSRGGLLAVNRDPTALSRHENLDVAISDAFRAAQRQVTQRFESQRAGRHQMVV